MKFEDADKIMELCRSKHEVIDRSPAGPVLLEYVRERGCITADMVALQAQMQKLVEETMILDREMLRYLEQVIS